ncbi:MAG: GxxExxY protein [Candidatus Margulisiibacteriota bacterium]
MVGRLELIQNKRSFRRRMHITEALINDGDSSVKVIWFNQPYIGKNLKEGDLISIAGKVEEDVSGPYFSAPSYERLTDSAAVHTQGLVPNYHLTEGLTQKQLRFFLSQIIKLAEELKDWLPEEIRKKHKLSSYTDAVKKIHFPKTLAEAETARRRIAFNELILLQLQSQLVRRELADAQAVPIPFQEEATKKFVGRLNFKLTNDQRKTAWAILRDLERARPMSRLLEGDVGSGKTVVAALALLNVALAGKQAVLLAPTEILASQHFNTLTKLFAGNDIKIGLVTRGQTRTNADEMRTDADTTTRTNTDEMRTDADTTTRTNTDETRTDVDFTQTKADRKKNSEGNKDYIIKNSDIVIGTHALIQDKIEFRNLALAVIDEQHRFGVEQRAKLLTRTNADFTKTSTDGTKKNELLYEELTYKIRGAVFEVKKNLGLGHKEKVYQGALEEEFKKINLKFDREKRIDIKYNDKKVGIYQPDFVINDKIIVEIKKLPFVGKIEKEQVWSYLKGTNYELALLVNFSNTDVHFERIINSKQFRSVGVKSASSPRESVYSPHLLSLTATPIPRSLALGIYGDLDISVIKESPLGRKKILTKIVAEDKRAAAYKFIREQIMGGRQVFVICPLIDFSDRLGVKAVKQEYERLDKQIFPDLKIGILHGKMKAAEKEKVMREFLENKIKILVSTSVVEVGVDVPNASVMIIEGAERFGLAQLHQFRGRVGRSVHQSYCFLFSESAAPASLARLETLVNHFDGFELAKMDLKFRGAGQLFGTEQSGFPELKIATLFDYELMKEAREAALALIDQDSELKKWPELKALVRPLLEKIHLE